ncbi:unnamed protein product [Callosobruchus maculatus]|uniref:CHHC U11-48K-type domain-containing protein n=1 Tax=Callosobruchus maculatus TaxID=64391 RepID=A0A653C6S4_CALMS|nr:unnamed protein product [Callosobruchus maculatus]
MEAIGFNILDLEHLSQAPEVIPGDNRYSGFTEVARRLRETACRGGVAASTTDHRTFGLRQCPLIADHLVKASSMANHLVRCRRRLAEGHAPSEDSIMKAVYVNKEAFLCKNCVSEPECTSDVGLLKKEIECLTREKSLMEKYVSELEFSNGLLKSQLSCSNNKSTSVTNSAKILSPAKTYSEQVKSVKTAAVLVVRSSDQNIANTDLEREMKAKIRPGSLNANVLGTKLIKNGIIINCENSSSLQKLKDGLQREMGNKCSVYEQKKFNPKIIVYSVNKSLAGNDKLIEYIIKDNRLDAGPSDVKLITKLNYKNSVNLILELKPALFKTVINTGYLYVGHVLLAMPEVPGCSGSNESLILLLFALSESGDAVGEPLATVFIMFNS